MVAVYMSTAMCSCVSVMLFTVCTVLVSVSIMSRGVSLTCRICLLLVVDPFHSISGSSWSRAAVCVSFFFARCMIIFFWEGSEEPLPRSIGIVPRSMVGVSLGWAMFVSGLYAICEEWFPPPVCLFQAPQSVVWVSFFFPRLVSIPLSCCSLFLLGICFVCVFGLLLTLYRMSPLVMFLVAIMWITPLLLIVSTFISAVVFVCLHHLAVWAMRGSVASIHILGEVSSICTWTMCRPPDFISLQRIIISSVVMYWPVYIPMSSPGLIVFVLETVVYSPSIFCNCVVPFWCSLLSSETLAVSIFFLSLPSAVL